MEIINDGSNGSSGSGGGDYSGYFDGSNDSVGTDGTSGNNNDYQLGTPNTPPVKSTKKSFWRKLIDFFKRIFGIN